ncbi:MAG TPA: type II secretion system protein GspM [Burkholderiales bacterium]|jgi:MSHA biogenesis protein MshJ|nr:type II secretion system protein GspM [Burkholderiales bacterium]
MRLPPVILNYAKRVDAMSLRERVLVFLAAVVILVALVNYALLEPILHRQKTISQDSQRQQDEIRAMQVQLQAYAQAQLSGGSTAKRKRLEERKAEIAELDRALGGQGGELVTADRMTRMLSDILKRNPEVVLVSLRSLPATGLTQVPTASTGSAVMYRHGIEVTVSGSYFKMLGYVADLERNPAKILWGAMDLQAAYPNVTLKVTLYTLSPDKTWLLI